MKGIIEEEIIGKSGGKFHLTSLLQKRLREYLLAGQLGARREDGTSILDEVLGEVRDGDIRLEEEVVVVEVSIDESEEEGEEEEEEE